jgi:hypothetical protein
MRANDCANTRLHRSTFFHPDFTVGSGVTPDPARDSALVGFTTDRELRSPSHPAPKVIQAGLDCQRLDYIVRDNYNLLHLPGQCELAENSIHEVLDKYRNLV